MQYRMTVHQLYNACQKYPYLLLRHSTGVVGINTKIAGIALKKPARIWSQTTKFIGYQPCSFDEYIQYKIPFI